MMAARFSTKSDFSGSGDPRGIFVYDGANGPLPPASTTSYVYDAMRERVPLHGAPLAATGVCLTGARRPTVAGTWSTGKERDAETGLDYFGARYFSAVQGRFTSPDAPFADQDPVDPQSWNLYGYGRNNPLRFTDPSGMYVCSDSMADSGGCRKFEEARGRAIDAAMQLKGQQQKDALRAIDAYGEPGIDNGVTIGLGKVQKGAAAETAVGGNLSAPTSDNPTGQNIQVVFDPGSFGETAGTAALSVTLAHEGSHDADGSEWIASGFKKQLDPSHYQTEMRAFGVSAGIAEGLGVYTNGFAYGSTAIWQPGWSSSQVQQGIMTYLAVPGLYGYTAASQGGSAFSRRTRVRR
jgi:RHS repeat-associated protein